MTASPSAKRRRSTKHKDDISELEPEEVLDVHSVHDSSPEPLDRQSFSSTLTPYEIERSTSITMAPRLNASQNGSSRSKTRRNLPEDVIDISTDGSIQHDDADMLDFEDVDIGGQDGEDDDLDMENVDLGDTPADTSGQNLQDMYAAAYHEAQSRPTEGGEEPEEDDDEDAEMRESIPIYKDGKGQHKGVEISMSSRSKKQESDVAKKKSTNILTPRDRQNRIHAHKLYVLSILAHTRVRNNWCNDQKLRDHLAGTVPEHMYTKLRTIHPKKVTEQRERIRMFESFLSELVRWWAGRFKLDPDMTAKSALRQPDQDIATGVLPGPGVRVDGWLVESAAQREERHKHERKEIATFHMAKEKAQQVSHEGHDKKETQRVSQRGKGKAKASAPTDASLSDAETNADAPSSEAETNRKVQSSVAPVRAMEITIFAPGTAVRPVYLRLLPAAESISSAKDLVTSAAHNRGSRETSAQLFCALCRSLGIPARLVVSPQPMPWSVGASKLANTAQPGSQAEKKANKLRAKINTGTPKFASKPLDEFTSDDEYDSQATAGSKSSARATSIRSGNSSDYHSSVEEVEAPAFAKGKNGTNLAKKAVLGATASKTRAAPTASGRRSKARTRNDAIDVDDTHSDTSSKAASSNSVKGKNKAEAIEIEDEEATEEADDKDYRPDKWKGLTTPLKVEHTVKLRPFRPKQLKASEVAAGDDAPPVDLQTPPTMWVEVFSKPYQKWITVDPVRALVRPSGNRYMEPATTDRQNKFVYIVGFEEDGYARDVTARYTKTLNSRVSRLRPPTRAKGEQDWWSKVAHALHRPQKLDRDAMEDAELQDHSSREPLPMSMAGFKDHPIYFVEKNLKRDEVIFPRRQIATFQGTPVFPKSDVLTLRSSRQWFNEGRVVKDNEVALKFVKSRGYTLANKRAEEQARSEGREVAQEGLYAEFQTKLYVPPPVGPDGRIPTNAFGNIDLFVPTMLPAGAVHLPFSGVAKVAKKLGVPYAEAITGFEFRKQRGMPKITGIVVAEESRELVEEAFWQQEHEDALKQQNKRMERAMKNWRKLINALRIAKRVQEQYRDKIPDSTSTPTTPQKAKHKADASASKSKYFSPQKGAEMEEVADPTTENSSVAAGSSPVLSNADAQMSPSSPASGIKRKIISMAQLASATPNGSGDDAHSSSASDADEPHSPAKRARVLEPADQPDSASRSSRRRTAAKTQVEVPGPSPRRSSGRTSTSQSSSKRYTEESGSEEADEDAEVDKQANGRPRRRINVSLKRRS